MYLKNSIYIFISFIMSFAVMSSSIAETAYDFSFNTIDGELLPLSDYKGKVLLVVNTASFCGFTPQYEALQSLWSDYKDKGLVVLGVPSNDFMNQEPGSADEIKDFCETNFSIDFPPLPKATRQNPRKLSQPSESTATKQRKTYTTVLQKSRPISRRNRPLVEKR